MIEYDKKNIFIQKSCRKWDRETSSETLFIFLKSFILSESKWSAAWFHYVLMALKLAYNKNKQLKTLHYWSRDILNFEFLDKGLGLVSPPHFVYTFSPKMYLKLYSVNWPSFIVWLPFLLEILNDICTAIKFQIYLNLSNQVVFIHDQKVNTRTWISWEQK